MFPHARILGLDLYTIALCLGIVVCFLTFSALADRRRIPVRVQKLAIISGIFGIALGYGAAVLTQALYNIKSLGRFEITNSTGATFYGGLLGGAAVFLTIYFIVGRFYVKENAHAKCFFDLATCITPAIAVAHGFGRIGCLCAGCCHGKVTDAWYGIFMLGDAGYAHYVPVQLFEAVFLLALFAFLAVRAYRGYGYGLPLYMSVYGVWRFFIEYIRGDYRGSSLIDFLTPSQLIAAVLVLVGVGVMLLERRIRANSDAVSEAETAADKDTHMQDGTTAAEETAKESGDADTEEEK